MAKCAAVSDLLSALPLIGEALHDASLIAGKGMQFLSAGLLSGDPLAVAAVLVGLIFLVGVYQLTRIGGTFLALTGFFLFVLCSV